MQTKRINISAWLRLFTTSITFAVLYTQISVGQSNYQEVASDLGVNVMLSGGHYGSGVSLYDWDEDGWPDISFGNVGGPPIFYHNDSGTFNEVDFNIPNTHQIMAILWVDYDNDLDPDLFITRKYGPWSLYQNDGAFQFTDVTNSSGLGQIEVYDTYGASWGDIDNDGNLDLYICTYYFMSSVENFLFKNNGNGTFTDISITSGASDGSRTSFQSAFFDNNEDGFVDLYVINDREMGNGLYENNGDGTFDNISASSGVEANVNAMSNTIGDYDNDGDFDIYVTNSIPGNVLLQNNGNGTFSDYTATAEVSVFDECWGAIFSDHDLDGWMDLFVGSTGLLPDSVHENHFFMNEQDGTFDFIEESGFQNLPSFTYCSAAGDLDNDGDEDFVLTCDTPYVNEIWRNVSPSQNGYLKVNLHGIISNSGGIGSRVTCYANDLIQTKFSRCGDQYLSQNSQYLTFGLGNASMVDSVTVAWPSGVVDVIESVSINQMLTVTEGMSNVTVGLEQNDVMDEPFAMNENGIQLNRSVQQLSVFDVSGKLITSFNKQSRGHLKLNLLPKGVYIVQWIELNRQVGTSKFCLF
ncbi:MAG: VCBS repeat-containing protein [Flavobacteriales bacterium]|nr:VCBS repeat-containing protein [Flavobacteriales bacterium]